MGKFTKCVGEEYHEEGKGISWLWGRIQRVKENLPNGIRAVEKNFKWETREGDGNVREENKGLNKMGVGKNIKFQRTLYTPGQEKAKEIAGGLVR